MSRQKILMCAPDYFSVAYVINPWMENNRGKTDSRLASEQWEGLRNLLAPFVDIALLPPQPKLPDMVFTANAGLVLRNIAVVSRFTSPERRGEEPHFRAWFSANGFKAASWPEELTFEGAGDSLFDRAQPLLWQGSGYRSDPHAGPVLEKILGCQVNVLKLVDPRFYHLDTCFCPLANGYLLYYPGAFAPESRALIETTIPADKRIVADEASAARFACNAVEINGRVIMNEASTELQDRLRLYGFEPITTPLSEFMKSGGGAKCLTLKLVEALA